MRDDIVMDLRSISRELENKFGIKKIALFGSYARGEANDDSDVDILVLEIVRKNGFIIASAKRYLSEYLKKDVDLGLYDSLRPFIKRRVLEDIIYV